MKKRMISLAISAAFVLAVFSGCAAMRRNTTNDIRGNDALDRSSDNLRNYLARGANYEADGQMSTGPNGVANPGLERTEGNRPITVDHLSSLVGMSETDINTIFGSDYRMNGTGMSTGRVYNHLLYGSATDVDFSFNDGRNIEQITVTASRADAQRWQRELNSRYGTQVSNNATSTEWLANGSRVVMQPYGDNVRIVFSNAI